jgi:hypothetical protein
MKAENSSCWLADAEFVVAAERFAPILPGMLRAVADMSLDEQVSTAAACRAWYSGQAMHSSGSSTTRNRLVGRVYAHIPATATRPPCSTKAGPMSHEHFQDSPWPTTRSLLPLNPAEWWIQSWILHMLPYQPVRRAASSAHPTTPLNGITTAYAPSAAS